MSSMVLRRAGLALGLAATLTGGVAVAGATAAQAQVPPCTEYVEVFQSTQTTNVRVGPRLSSREPGGVIFISNSAQQTRFLTHTGVTRPRRSATFRYVNQNEAVVRQHTTRPSRDNGVIHHEPEQIPYDFTSPGDTVRVFADFQTRCGGDDVPARNVFLGSIVTVD